MFLRAPDSDEAPAVAKLLAPRWVAAFGTAERVLEELSAEWANPEFDLARDAVVAERAGGGLLGYAVAHRFGSFATVDPGREGEGIGTALLDWCEQRQLELGWGRHRTSAPASDQRARDLLGRRGYTLLRSSMRMAVALDALPDSPLTVAVRLRPLDATADARTVYELDRAAFEPVPSTEPESLEAFGAEHFEATDLDPSLCRIAERGEAMAGFALIRRHDPESVAHVDILAVHPGEQSRGIGRALLLSALTAARESGLTHAELSVDSDNPRALSLYESVGMRPRAELDIYQRLASPTAET